MNMSTWKESMVKYMGKAVVAREQFYKGLDEARDDFINRVPGSPYANASTAEDAEYQFGNTPKGKLFISDNRWHMAQAIMFGVASIAGKMGDIAADVHAIRQMMEEDRVDHPSDAGTGRQRNILLPRQGSGQEG